MTRAVGVFLVGAAVSCSAVAAAQTPVEVDGLLTAWQLDEANQELEALRRASGDTSAVLYLEGRRLFMLGEYGEAVKKVDAALSGEPREAWRREREVMAATRDVVSSYTRHVSPRGYFAVYLDSERDEVLLPWAFEALDRAYEALGDELGWRPQVPIRVEVYPSAATLARVSTLTEAEIRTSGTIALCKYNRLMITSPRALLRGYPWVDTLVHEYVHYVVNQRSRNRVPIWMHEGLAKFLERRWRGEQAHQLAPSSEDLLRRRIEARELISFEQMHPSMAKLPSQEDAAVAFAEVYTAMEFLRREAGPGAFRRLLDGIVEGKPAQQAFADVLGTSFAEFERRWRADLAARPGVPDFPDASGFEERLVFRDEAEKPKELEEVDQPKARDHLHLGELMQGRGRFEAAVVEYEKAVRIAGDANPVLQTRLAQSLRALERHGEARQALGRVQRLFPGYVVTWIELGKAHRGAGEPELALEALSEAARLNPFDPEVHRELGLSYQALGRLDEARQARHWESLVK